MSRLRKIISVKLFAPAKVPLANVASVSSKSLGHVEKDEQGKQKGRGGRGNKWRYFKAAKR